MIDLSKYSEIIIWGASFPQGEVEGDATSHGRAIESLRNLLNENGYWGKVICIVDSKTELYGKKRLGIQVDSPAMIKNHPEALIIVNTISIKAIQKAMAEMGIGNDYLIIPYYFYHGTLDHCYSNEDALHDVSENGGEIDKLYYLKDKQTKGYMDIIRSMRRKNQDDLYTPEYYKGTEENISYFCDPVLAPKNNVTYIDVGAYDGNSIEPALNFYGNRMKKILAFEPDEKSRVKLKEYIDRTKIGDRTQVFPYALGSEDRILRFSSSGLVSIVSEQGESAIVQKVFDELPDVEIDGDIMVKMDIEGAELDALKGMSRLIKEHQPYLAICLYHKVQDLYEIAKFIKDLNPGYRLYLRGGWHLECWAVPQRHFE